MKYVYVKDNVAHEIIQDFDPVFPDVPIEERYSADFLSHCVPVDDNEAVEQHWIYDGEHFAPPPEPAPEVEE